MTHYSAERFFDLVLWLAGAGHFIILAASFQVPARLRWKQELAQLMPLNRKLLWVQSGFTVLTIIAFRTLTLALHAELMRGDRAAIGLACLIAIYWTGRILVDAFLLFPTRTGLRAGGSLSAMSFLQCCSWPSPSVFWGLLMWQIWFR